MRVLVFGGSGMLGHKLVQVLKTRFDVWTTVRTKFDEFQEYEIFNEKKIIENVEVDDLNAIKNAIEIAQPEVVINAVGIIKQIGDSKDVVKTLSVNSIFPHRLAELTQEFETRLITVGTDCVFSGRKGNYAESDTPDATDLYGKSKNLGEIHLPNTLTLRTSIIGRELQTSHSLVEWFLGNRGGKVKGFTRAMFSGFSTIALANLIAEIIENHKNLQGLYHVSSEPISKYDLLCLLKKHYRVPIEIEPDGDFEIDRTLNSTSFRKATGIESESWENMVEQMAKDSTPYDDFRYKANDKKLKS